MKMASLKRKALTENAKAEAGGQATPVGWR